MNKKRKKVFIITGVIAVLVLTFMIYWKATENDRYIKKEKNNIVNEISEFRSGKSSFFYFHIGSVALEDPSFIDFLSAQGAEMVKNGEYDLLDAFLYNLEKSDANISKVRDNITVAFENCDNLENAFTILETLKNLKYYNANLNLKRDSEFISSYIKSNGVEEITTTPGTGFYADEKDSYYKKRIGLDTSPLYDSKRITYQGDFKITKSYGVELNSYYRETPYSYTYYSFRDNGISFSPDDGEIIYSGDYLFCFNSDGSLIGYKEIKKN